MSRNKSTSGSRLAETKHDGKKVGAGGGGNLCPTVRNYPCMCVASHQQCERQWQRVPDVALFHYRWRWQTWGLRVFFVELHPDDSLHLWRLVCSFTTRWFISASSLMSTVCFTALRRLHLHRLALIIAPQLLTHRSPHKSYFVFIYLVMIIALPQRLIWSISSCLHCVLTL